MLFLLILCVAFYVPWFFAESLFAYSEITHYIGIGYVSLFVLSFVLLVYFFRNIKTNYAFGTRAFALWLTLTVPSIFFFIPGLIYRTLLENENLLFIGWGLAILNFMAMLNGMFFGRWNWKIHAVSPDFENVPDSLKQLKIVQISDIHVGTFLNNYKRVEGAIEKINKLEADYVFFTGDLVNNTASEMDPWISIFSKIQAKKGKFSILGNHDYGDYVRWTDASEKTSNFQKLIDTHKAIGFTPLLNESIEIEKDVWLLGVENWGKPPFRQSGDLDKALSNIPEKAFKILLSHDPSHFDFQVVNKTNIHLTLSGHTHGMQFGIERFGMRWSPVKFRYKKWAGLYRENKQFLYVNRGFGVLGFPGRVGIFPEITFFTFQKDEV